MNLISFYISNKSLKNNELEGLHFKSLTNEKQSHKKSLQEFYIFYLTIFEKNKDIDKISIRHVNFFIMLFIYNTNI